MSYDSGVRIKLSVDNDVHTALRNLKGRGESFNDVLRRLLELPEYTTDKPVPVRVHLTT